MDTLVPYELPAEVLHPLIEVARTSEVLLFGELHGTQEVPRLLLALLPDLATAGYRGLALEIPHPDREALADWAVTQRRVVPDFFAHPLADGRGNRQVLALIEHVLSSQHNWHLLCFDQGPEQAVQRWADRDGWMAHNCTEQWQLLCPAAKVVGICGNLHSRLLLPSQPDATTPYWPSFAHQLHRLHPEKTICTINIRFQTGAYFNMKRRPVCRFGWPWLHLLSKPVLRESKDHSFELLLPRATPATFLTKPRLWSTASTSTLRP